MLLKNEVTYLRELAGQVSKIAEKPEQEVKREEWKRHNSLKPGRPMIFIHPDGAWTELLPQSALKCESALGRAVEYQLLQKIIRDKYIPDDVPIEGNVKVSKVIHNSMWGLRPKVRPSTEQRGSWHHEPVIHSSADWEMLKAPVVEYDDALTRRVYQAVGDALGDILTPRLIGVANFSFHMMHWYCDYRGLDNMMMDLVDEPKMVHSVIRFFTDGVKSMLKQYEKLSLISLNNDDTFFYTGGVGYTDELPKPGFDPERIRLCDVWGAAEAQEFSCISPSMHEEFILSYEREVLEPFGLTGYGCCDDLAKKLDGVLKINNIRRIAICPWANISDFAGRLSNKYIMTWKPQPAHLAYDSFNEDIIRNELRSGVAKAKGGFLELILRDTHTCRNEPERFRRWVEIARESTNESI